MSKLDNVPTQRAHPASRLLLVACPGCPGRGCTCTSPLQHQVVPITHAQLERRKQRLDVLKQAAADLERQLAAFHRLPPGHLAATAQLAAAQQQLEDAKRQFAAMVASI